MTQSPAKPAPPIEQMLAAMEGWGASDLLVSAGKVPAVRLHGSVVALEVPPTPPDEVERFVLAALDEVRQLRMQRDGAVDTGYALPSGARFRLRVGHERGALEVTAHALPSRAKSLAELGLPASLGTFIERRSGLLLVAGPAGSGRSTTLAALVHALHTSRPLHIVTLEDPVEMLHADGRGRVTQREIFGDTPSYAAGLRGAMQQGADVIVIGQLLNHETLRAALDAALAGQLVIAAMTAADTTQALSWAVGLAPATEREQTALDLAAALIGITVQQLLPRRDGQGRVAVVETMSATPEVAERIRERRFLALGRIVARDPLPGVVSFDAALAALCDQGALAPESALAYATDAESVVKRLHGAVAHGADFGRPVGFDLPSLLALVIRRGASDLHLSVGKPPTLRIDGRLEAHDTTHVTASDLESLVRGSLSEEQRARFAHDKEIDFAVSLGDGKRFRVNAYHERGEVAVAFRAISSQIPDAAMLGLPPSVLRMGEEPHGLLLVVGPTGSGKTTTLACLTDRINHLRPCHIITIEDPIEYVHTSDRATIHQREVGADTASFAAALKYILRQDPDVVLIGELRDLETVSAALTAAETGHLVMATLHTNDAIQTIDRIIDVFPPYQQAQARAQLSASLIGVVSQRLLPRADGKGRLAAFEVMLATPAIRTLVREAKMHQALGIMQASRTAGMITMEQALEELLRRGAIDKDEAVRYMQGAGNADKSRPKASPA